MVTHGNTLWVYFANAGPVVKAVMLLLVLASIISWTLIFQRGLLLKRAQHALRSFEDKFWSGIDLNRLYNESARVDEGSGLESIFCAGFKEFMRMRKAGAPTDTIMEATARAMRIAQSREMDHLEQHVPLLATIGSTSPYVGLFGTVWGIMTAFHAISANNVQQATIAMVAPGISEALIATAMGLFAAIPAVIAYNRYANDIERLLNHYSTFQEEFSSILQRLVHTATTSQETIA